MKNFKIENIKKEYVLGIIILIAISLLFFGGNNITGFFVSPITDPGGVDMQTYDAYKALVDSYTPTWNERYCYTLFGLEEDSFDKETYNQVYQIYGKTSDLGTSTSREYTSASSSNLIYLYDKFSICSFVHQFTLNNFTPVLFEQIKNDIYQEIDQDSDYKKIADFNCNNGKVSMVMWEQPNGALTRLLSFVIFPEEEVPGGFAAEERFRINTSKHKIAKVTSLVNGDKFAYFNYKIVPYRKNYCNPNLPTNITFTE